jgi:hypothetical protein
MEVVLGHQLISTGMGFALSLVYNECQSSGPMLVLVLIPHLLNKQVQLTYPWTCTAYALLVRSLLCEALQPHIFAANICPH